MVAKRALLAAIAGHPVFVKCRFLLVLLLLLTPLHAEKVESTGLGFSATAPVKMRMSSAANSSGKTTSFEGKNQTTGVTYLIQVEQNQKLARKLEGKPDSLKPILDQSLKAYTSSVQAGDAAVKSEWKKAFSKDALFFDFQTTGYLAGSERSTTHSGLKFFHHGGIFTVQAISAGGTTTEETRKALLELMKGFSLLDRAAQGPKK